MSLAEDPPTPPACPTARLFYALWPDASAREALQAQQRAWRWPDGVVLTPPERLHLTLHFLGDVPITLRPELAEALPGEMEPFELRLAQPALWNGDLAVLLAEEASAPLLALHGRLQAALQGLGLPTGTRPFAPHVTLARAAQQAEPPVQPQPIAWTVRGAVLVESLRPQGGYHVLAGAAG